MKPKVSLGAVMALADQIQEALFQDWADRQGFDAMYDEFTHDVREEIRTAQVKKAAEVIERFFS